MDNNDISPNTSIKALVIVLFIVFILTFITGFITLYTAEPKEQKPLIQENTEVQAVIKDTLDINDVADLFSKHQIDREYLYITIAEKGFEKKWIQSNCCNNLFGFSYDGNTLLKFPSLDSCVKYFKNWLTIAPRKENESLPDFMKRRGWNTNPAYYSYIKDVMMVPHYKEFIEA